MSFLSFLAFPLAVMAGALLLAGIIVSVRKVRADPARLKPGFKPPASAMGFTLIYVSMALFLAAAAAKVIPQMTF
jgi:uncharacterized membrane protein AbrB (regulator of aidB expression)